MINDSILKKITFKINKYKEDYNLLNAQLKEFNPKLLLENYKIKFMNIKNKMIVAQKNIYNNVENKIRYYDKLLYHNNPYNILNKGFAVVSDKQNKLIKKVENINLNEEINIQFQDGLASAKIKSKESSND